jgi:trigger factor
VEFTVNEISVSEKEIEVKLKYDEIKSDLDEEVKKQSKKLQVPGFRKGKVPPPILKKMFGDALEFEASEKVANSRFWKIAEVEQLNPIGQPVMMDIDFKPGNDLKFKVKYEILPELEVRNYSGQTIEVPDFHVKDEEVEKEIDHIIKSNRTTEDAELVGDDLQYLLDAELVRLKDDGEVFENAKSEKLQIDLTTEKIQQEIRENAKGKKTGESFTFSFDDERTIKNKEGVDEKFVEHFSYRVNILAIKKIIYPELTEEFIKKITKDKVSTVEEFKNQIRHDIEHYYHHRTEDFVRSRLIGMIIKNNDFVPPASFVANLLDDMTKNEEDRLKKQGLKQINREELRNYLKPGAENEVKWYLLRSAIQKKENLQISDKDLEDLAKHESEHTGLPIDKLINYYKNSNQNEKLLDKKIFNFLTGNNNIVKVDPSKFIKPENEEANV